MNLLTYAEPDEVPQTTTAEPTSPTGNFRTFSVIILPARACQSISVFQSVMWISISRSYVYFVECYNVMSIILSFQRVLNSHCHRKMLKLIALMLSGASPLKFPAVILLNMKSDSTIQPLTRKHSGKLALMEHSTLSVCWTMNPLFIQTLSFR